MVRKKLAIAVLAISALQATYANAMGLGNLSIKSALNQPLNADIKLLDTGDLDPTQVKIQLATSEDFQRAGVDRDYFLTNLHFSVDMDGHGGGVIHVSTREPVVEPYLNFVIEARWPNGRLLREFAVLLDPPTFSGNRATAPVAPATSSGISTVQHAKKAPVQPPTISSETETSAAAPSADMSLPSTGKPGEYRVQVYDTLSKIATKNKPASDVTVAQTMVAIQRANPQVFINNNVNLIKSGYVLRLPTADEARATTADQAAQDVEAQTASWRGGSARSTASAPVSGPQLDASTPEPSKKEGGYREQARLSIATPGEGDKSAAGSGAGGGKGTEALRSQLAASQEALEKGKRDNHELQSRLDDMERQIATLQRLITLKDDQLTALQTKAADKAAPAQQPAPVAPAPATTSTPATAAAPTEAPAATPPVAQAESPKPVEAPKPAPIKPAIKPVVAPEPSLLDRLMANPLYLVGGAGVVLLALIGLFVAKRRKDAEEEEESTDYTFDEQDNFQFATADLDTASISDDAITPAPAEPATDDVMAPDFGAEAPPKAAQPQTGDAIAESDIYIAYGRYQQAVDLLSNAINAEPNRSDLRVKLLEVYVEMRNKDAFRQQFVALHSLGDSDAVAKVKDMLSSVDGVSDWLVDLPSNTPSWSNASLTAAAATTAAVTSEWASPQDEEVEPELDLPADELGELDLDLDDNLDSSSSLAAFDDLDFTAPATESTNELELDLDADGIDELDVADATDDEFETPQSLAEPQSQPYIPPQPPVQSQFNAGTAFEMGLSDNPEEGFELDLGDEDLDRALREMGDSGELGDLEAMADNLRDIDLSPAPIAEERDIDAAFTNNAFDNDLGADLELPEEFDLSSAAEELPDIQRTDMSFDELVLPEEFEHNPAVAEAPAAPTFDAPPPAFEPAPVLEAGDDFDFLSDTDEIATKLDLARAYIDMGDTDGARDILDEVLQEGSDVQKQEASSLISRIG